MDLLYTHYYMYITDLVFRGNFANEPPYSTGSKPCESCPYTHKYCTYNLCCKSMQLKVMLLHNETQFNPTAESGAPMVGPISLMGLLVMAIAALFSHL